MSVSRQDVQHVAKLAELAVDQEELPELTAQMDRIVSFVAQLGADGADRADQAEGVDRVGGGNEAARYVPGPERVTLRDDLVQPADLARPPAVWAPEFVDGFFVVPKLGGMEEP